MEEGKGATRHTLIMSHIGHSNTQPRHHRHHHHHLASIGSERDLPLSGAAVAAAAAAGMDGPSHLLEAMLGALLVLVRECPEVRSSIGFFG